MTKALPPSKDGGDGDEEVTVPPPAPMTEGRNRKALIEDENFELSPMTLVGSWFHRLENGEIVWDGVVVGEPQPGKYLIQVRKGMDGLDRAEAQVLMGIDQMFARDEGYEFRFYDTREAMFEAYAEFVVGKEAMRYD